MRPGHAHPPGSAPLAVSDVRATHALSSCADVLWPMRPSRAGRRLASATCSLSVGCLCVWRCRKHGKPNYRFPFKQAHRLSNVTSKSDESTSIAYSCTTRQAPKQCQARQPAFSRTVACLSHSGAMPAGRHERKFACSVLVRRAAYSCRRSCVVLLEEHLFRIGAASTCRVDHDASAAPCCRGIDWSGLRRRKHGVEGRV